MNSKASFDAPRFLPWLPILFTDSGCSAPIYEIVWYQWLQVVIGSTAISLGFLLATFMGKPMHPLRTAWIKPFRSKCLSRTGQTLIIGKVWTSVFTSAVYGGMDLQRLRAQDR
jgi:hypothetical protein